MNNFKNCFAFDLGTSKLRIFHNGKLAIEAESEIFQNGKVYDGLFKNGLIADFKACDTLIRNNLKKIRKPFLGFIDKPFTSIVSVPAGCNDVTLRAYRDLMENAGARVNYMLNDTFIAGIGMGIDIWKSTFTVVDFGAGKTSITSVENKKIINYEIFDISMNYLTEQIEFHLSKTYDVKITRKVSEKLLIENVNLNDSIFSNRRIKIEGHKKNSNEIKNISVESNEISGIIKNEVDFLIERIVRNIENLNENTQKETLKQGLYVIGSTSKLNGFKDLLNSKVRIAPICFSFLDSAMNKGFEIVLGDPGKYLEFMIV